MSHHPHQQGTYYLPGPSYWPIVGSIGLFFFMWGAVHWVHHEAMGPYFFFAGAFLLIYMMYGWFSVVISEDQAGLHNEQMERSYRWAMVWFIFSEVCFFAAFFGVLYYVRAYAVPSLAGMEGSVFTKYLLWPNFQASWPLLQNPDPVVFIGPKGFMHAWGVPALNTFILLSSGVTITVAHWGIFNNNRRQLILFMTLTLLLGISFLTLQAHEYILAYTEYGLTLGSGIYGSTFFMLTGFHGLHVTLGILMLMVILGRCMKGHFTPEHHFAFEGVAWYWHFVDVVWLMLFVFVYWL